MRGTIAEITVLPEEKPGNIIDVSQTSMRLREIETPGGRLSRLEWQLYTELLKPEYKLGRLPTYGDYTIETPDFALGMDFRKISPAAKITYTVPDEWLVVKGLPSLATLG